jgi:hypothetical protein
VSADARVAPNMIGRMDKAARSPTRPARWPTVAVFCILWGLITHGTFAGSGDEPHYMLIAHSIAFDRDLDLRNDYRDATLITAGTLEPEAHAVERHGRLRPVHDIGMPLLLSPVVGLAYLNASAAAALISPPVLQRLRLTPGLLFRHQLSLVMVLLACLLAREIQAAAIVLGSTPRAAAASSLVFALSPPILSHSFLFFTELPTALIACFVFRRICLPPATSRRDLLTSAALGVLVGALVFLHVRNVGLAMGLAAVALVPGPSRIPRPAGFLCGVLAMLAVRTVVNDWLWGSLVTTPHAALGSVGPASTLLSEVLVRANGLLFDREYGLFAYGPIYLAALPGLILASRRGALGWQVTAVVVAYLFPILLPMTNVHGWTGGWSPAARFMVPVAPLLWLVAWQYVSETVGAARMAAGCLLLLQAGIDAYVWQFPKTLWNDGDGTTALALARWLPSLVEPHSVLWMAMLMATWGIVGSALARVRPQPGAP